MTELDIFMALHLLLALCSLMFIAYLFGQKETVITKYIETPAVGIVTRYIDGLKPIEYCRSMELRRQDLDFGRTKEDVIRELRYAFSEDITKQVKIYTEQNERHNSIIYTARLWIIPEH